MNTALSSRGSFCIRQHPVLPGVFPHAVSTRGTRTVAALWPLLAIPDAPPACFRHWRRQAPVPQAARDGKPSPVQCRTHPQTPRELDALPDQKEITPTFVGLISFGIRQRPTLPGRLQPSTIGAERLNFCVRYGNRWIPFAIVTGILSRACAVLRPLGFGCVAL